MAELGTAAIDFYHRSASTIAPHYDRLRFEDVHPSISMDLPSRPGRILDIGAGTGRDAIALMDLGHAVTAVEPAPAMRALGELAAPDAQWINDRLPNLSLLPPSPTFDFILCSAVLMSLPSVALLASLERMARLLLPSGRLSISLRDPRPTEDVLHFHSDAALTAAAKASGLNLYRSTTAPDALGRSLLWRHYLFSVGDKNRSI